MSVRDLHARVLGGLRGLAWASGLLAVPTAGFAVHYAGGWAESRAGRDAFDQRASLVGVPFFKRPFLRTVERLREVVPEDALLLVEPAPARTREGQELYPYSGQARWFLYLTHFAYPLRVVVREPNLAAGTLVDYPRWIDANFAALYRGDTARRIDGDVAIERLGVEWRLRYVVAPPRQGGAPPPFHANQLVLERRAADGWERVELFDRGAPVDEDDAVDEGDEGDEGEDA